MLGYLARLFLYAVCDGPPAPILVLEPSVDLPIWHVAVGYATVYSIGITHGSLLSSLQKDSPDLLEPSLWHFGGREQLLHAAHVSQVAGKALLRQQPKITYRRATRDAQHRDALGILAIGRQPSIHIARETDGEIGAVAEHAQQGFAGALEWHDLHVWESSGYLLSDQMRGGAQAAYSDSEIGTGRHI